MNKVILKKGKLLKQVKIGGWSWGAFLFGPIWYCAYGLWGKALLYFASSLLLSWTVIVPIIMWFVMGAKFNEQRYEDMLERGYTE